METKTEKQEVTPMGAQDYIEQNSAYVVDLIQMALEVCCPSDCKNCVWVDVCVHNENKMLNNQPD